MIVGQLRRIHRWFQDAAFRRLFLNAGKLLSANCLSAVIGFVAVVLTAWTLGPEQYGVLALVLVYGLTLGTLATFNSWQAVIKYGSDAIEARNEAGLLQLVKFGFLLDIGSAAAGAVLALVLAGPVIRLLGWDESLRPMLMLYSLAILLNITGTPIGLLRLFDRFDLLGYSSIVRATTQLVGVIACVLSSQPLLGYVVAHLLATIVGQVFLLAASLWVLGRCRVAGVPAQPIARVTAAFPGIWDYAWTTQVNSSIRMISREADELIIAWLAGPASLGLFKMAKQFSRVLPMLIDPLYQSIYPELSRAWATADPRQLLGLVKRSTLLVSLPAIGGWLAFVVLGKDLIRWTVGEAYSEAYLPAVIYMLALTIGVMTFCLQPLMLAVGKPRYSLVANAVATTVYLAVIGPVTTALGVAGSAACYVLYYCVWTTVGVTMLRAVMAGARSGGREPAHANAV
jgi:O-antigen/teichoic acid export membrane protein